MSDLRFMFFGTEYRIQDCECGECEPTIGSLGQVFCESCDRDLQVAEITTPGLPTALPSHCRRCNAELTRTDYEAEHCLSCDSPL